MQTGEAIITQAREAIDLDSYRQLHWSGTFAEYLDLVRKEPLVTRSAFERMYDMILAAGTTEYIDNKKKIVHYNFFDDAINEGYDAIYGLDIPLMKLVNIFKSAAQRYGTERRVILLHGPVGSSKSTIARLLKGRARGVLEAARGRDVHLRMDPRSRSARRSDRSCSACALETPTCATRTPRWSYATSATN